MVEGWQLCWKLARLAVVAKFSGSTLVVSCAVVMLVDQFVPCTLVVSCAVVMLVDQFVPCIQQQAGT
jgi:hypothetical protein